MAARCAAQLPALLTQLRGGRPSYTDISRLQAGCLFAFFFFLEEGKVFFLFIFYFFLTVREAGFVEKTCH